MITTHNGCEFSPFSIYTAIVHRASSITKENHFLIFKIVPIEMKNAINFYVSCDDKSLAYLDWSSELNPEFLLPVWNIFLPSLHICRVTVSRLMPFIRERKCWNRTILLFWNCKKLFSFIAQQIKYERHSSVRVLKGFNDEQITTMLLLFYPMTSGL